jgi:hypothetical protein
MKNTMLSLCKILLIIFQKGFLLLFLTLFYACAIKNKTEISKKLYSIPTNLTSKEDIIDKSSNFIRHPNSGIHYLYNNKSDNFIKIKGDYFSTSHPKFKEINIIVGFQKKYRDFKNVLYTQIWVKSKEKVDLKKLIIQVKSSKFGEIKSTPIERNSHRDPNLNTELMFKTEILLDNGKQVLEKIYNDNLTITINGYLYEFKSPIIKN